MRYVVNVDDQEIALELEAAGPDRYVARFSPHPGAARRELEVRLLGERPALAVTCGGRVIELWPEGAGTVGARQGRPSVRLADARLGARRRSAEHDAARGVIRAPMPGRVIKVALVVGQRVSAGEPALVIEAMKMENELVCPTAGSVREILVEAGATVERGATLVVVE